MTELTRMLVHKVAALIAAVHPNHTARVRANTETDQQMLTFRHKSTFHSELRGA
jgi:hypothetical protein